MKRLIAMFSALGCASILIGLFGGLTCDVPPTGSEIPENTGVVKLRINNLSGLPAEVEETYVLLNEQVRHTLRFLPPDGPGASAEGIGTLADTITVRATVATEADLNSLAVPGDLLAARVFRFGEDFQNGETLVFDIPPPEEPAPNIIDCNRNGINDPIDITGGESDDCDSNTVPDECQADTDHDSFINPCDGCPNDVNKQEPGICDCGKPDTGDADSDGILDCVDTCTDTDDDGFGNPGFPANTCPQDGCVDDPGKDAPGICGCGAPDVGDADEDGVLDCVDPCPVDFFDDSDNDGLCDSADPCPHDPDNDADGDGVCGDVDACPDTPSEEDADSDGCSCSQRDPDRDDVNDCDDVCTNTPLEEDADSDGCSCSQRDPDRDGVNDCDDECADTPFEEPVNTQGCACSQVNCDDGDPCTLDTCEAGLCSNVFQDADSDGVCDANDECPGTTLGEEVDADGCSCRQLDADRDGVDDCDDECADTPAEEPVNAQGCACSQVNCNDGNPCTLDTCEAGVCSNVFQDADSDGVCDANDLCPDTPFGEEVDSDGCSCSQFDTDSDGVDDCDDECADTPAEEPVNTQGCACSQVDCNDGDPCTLDSCAAGVCSNIFQDADRDGVCDVNDECPGTPFGEEPDADGCSCSQRDPDSDGVDDCDDDCPDTPAEEPVNAQGCACSQVNCNDGNPCTLDTCAAGTCSNVFQDADNDDVCDVNDECPGTPFGEEPDADGCSCSQRDPDSDGVDDCDDECADTPAGQPANAQGCACSQVNCDDGDPCTLDSCEAGVCSNVFQDADSDGVCDLNDQCIGHDDNADMDSDGFPDGCDDCPTENSSAVDFDNDGCLDGTFNLDIRPNMCPNSLSAESNGLYPVALLGTPTFDVSQVDIATLRLTRADIVSGEVAPHGQSSLSSTGTPTAQALCDCNGTDADERSDLDIRFRLDDTIAALELAGLPDYTVVPLKLKGRLLNGTPFAAIDCVTTLPPSTEP